MRSSGKKKGQATGRSRHIPESVRLMLWGRAAGRCEFSGCNQSLCRHPLTQETVNLADTAHIVGFSEDGPRGESELSEELAKDITNLMLLCKNCHRTVDENSESYPVELLKAMKEAHEKRVELATEITEDRRSHILLYGANVGNHAAPLSFQKAAAAMFSERYPASRDPMSIGLVNSSFRDKTPDFWTMEAAQLRAQFAEQVAPRLARGDIEHLSIFGFAPQPLLMLLGFLISDIPAAEVYQLHREPPNWCWQPHVDVAEFAVEEPDRTDGPPALVLAISATVTDDRITAALGDDAAIWRITVPEPHNDVLKSREQLVDFRQKIRPVMDRIKAQYGGDTLLHIFPAAPLAVAIDFGRIIMPKADMPLRVYDENREVGGFVHALDINGHRPKESKGGIHE